jgi:AraC-like DNA-binding protein
MLGIGDYRIIENIDLSFEFKHSPVVFGFSVSGNIRFTVNYEEDQKDVWVFKSGHSFMSYLPEWKGVAEYPARTSVRTVGIYIDPLLLNTFMEGQHDQIPTGMRDIVNGANEKHYYHASTTTPPANMTIHQMFNCPYQCPLKRLYLESKALELISHNLAQFVSPKSTLKNPSVLRPDDIERIHHAKEIISRDLENPPTLFELARLVGLTHTKLNRGFREIYGTTVFGYLHKIRLERARLLLEEQRMNVTEVAFTVGYNSLPSFSTAFSKHFGLNPITCIKNSPHTCLL